MIFRYVGMDDHGAREMCRMVARRTEMRSEPIKPGMRRPAIPGASGLVIIFMVIYTICYIITNHIDIFVE